MQLRNHEIHVFTASLAMVLPEQWIEALSADEHDRANRLILPQHQQRFRIAHAILRHLLGLYLNDAPESFAFTYGDHRKPALAGKYANELQFNLSHSHDMAVYAFTRHDPIGIDIERIQAENKSDIATRFFSADEISTLATLPSAEQIAGFYHLWARKEAIIKANGKGLTQPLSSFSVSLANQPESVHIDHQQWVLYPLTIHHDYAAALAVANPIASLSIWDFIDQKPVFRSEINHSS